MRCFLLILFSFISQSLWAIEQSPRPMSRPELALKPAVTDSLRPNLRPRSVEDRAQRYRAALVRGQVCGDVRLQGKVMGRVSHKTRGCGIDNAVRVTSIDGVRLSQPVTLDCKKAKTFAHWVERSAQPVIGTQGGGLDRIDIMGHYACRPRNNKAGAKLSEHSKGRAIDIGGFRLKNGQRFSVLKDWSGSKWSDELRKLHKSACGPFGTVLGPAANKYHRDHFHFDTARYRSGSYCR